MTPMATAILPINATNEIGRPVVKTFIAGMC